MLMKTGNHGSTVVLKAHVSKADNAAPMTFTLSDDTVDRFGDVIEQDGWKLSNFRKNPIALFGHDNSFIVGNWRNIRVADGGLQADLELLDPVSDRLREVRTAVEAGVLRAVSVGFKPIKAEPIDEADPFGGTRFMEQELVEASLVAVGANPNALSVAKSLNLSRDTMEMIFGKIAAKEITATPAEPPASSPQSPKSTSKQMNLSQQIEAAQARVNAASDALTAHVGTFADGVITPDATKKMDELSDAVSAAKGSLASLQKAEQMLGVQSEIVMRSPTVPAPAPAPARPWAMPKTKQPTPADYYWRMAAIATIARGTQQSPIDVCKMLYGDDLPTRALVDQYVVVKAATVPATTTLAGWAAELVTTINVDIVDQLIPQSVYAPLSNAGGRFTFGRAGIVSIPSRAATPTLAGSFVAQGAPIPVRQAGFAAVTLTPKKMGVISVMTREIMEHSTPAIEAIVRQAMQDDTSVAIDSVLLGNGAATTTTPAGLRNGVSATTATAGGGFTALVGDIKNLVGVLAAANSLRRPVWIMNPIQALAISLTQNAGGDFPFQQEINGGRFAGYQLIQSTTMTAGMVILLDAADFFSATGDAPRFDASDQAVLHMEDTTPLAIGTTGSPNTVAAPTRSLWQTDCIGIRMLLDINWAMRRTGVIAWTTAVTW